MYIKEWITPPVFVRCILFKEIELSELVCLFYRTELLPVVNVEQWWVRGVISKTMCVVLC